jgi:hypothetical protein
LHVGARSRAGVEIRRDVDLVLIVVGVSELDLSYTPPFGFTVGRRAASRQAWMCERWQHFEHGAISQVGV